MSIYKNRKFSSWANNEGVTDNDLCKAVTEMKQGLYEASLGGGLVKKRVARSGAGKSGGFRVILATNFNNSWFFIYGFAKNVRSNIDVNEAAALKKLANSYLKMSQRDLENAKSNGKLLEVLCDG